MARLRRLLTGGDNTVSSSVSAAGRHQLGWVTTEPGPFDEPPTEPIDLAPDLPWELRED